jgi:NAD(P)-dependent dehydrogenase (short-subunit alcohol dehydrogenase family)
MTTIALVTGANRGLGLATARRLAETGAHVIVGSRDPARGEDVAEHLRSDGLSAESIQLDVTDRQQVAAAAARIRERHGRLDALVNNAGILPEATAASSAGPLDLSLFQQTFDTNVFGVVAVIEAFLPLLMEAEAASIVNVSSTMGSLADQTDPSSPYYEVVVPAYSTSKAAVNAITVALAKRLAGTTVRVTAVCPGFVQTELTPMNRDQAPLTADEASRVVVDAATAGAASPSGRFIDRDGAVAW